MVPEWMHSDHDIDNRHKFGNEIEKRQSIRLNAIF